MKLTFFDFFRSGTGNVIRFKERRVLCGIFWSIIFVKVFLFRQGDDLVVFRD